MKNIKTIFIKEMKRIFTDRRMLLALFLPGILIFVVYTVMGKLMNNVTASSIPTNVTYNVAYTDTYNEDQTNKPKLLSYLDGIMTQDEEKTNRVQYTKINASQVDEYVAKLEEGTIDVLVEFSTNFEVNVLNPEIKNNINIRYNGSTEKGSRIYQLVSACVEAAYKNYTINEGGAIISNVSDTDSVLVSIMGFIIPMVTISLLFSTAISVCPESIAGEKERGTLANMLLTPIKRSELVIAKILSLTITAVLSGIFSFAGLVTSIPSLFGGTSLGLGPVQIILFLLIVVTTLVFFCAFGIFVSSFTMTTKEATSILGPLVMLFMALAMLPNFIGASPSQIGLAFIPVVNVSSCMSMLMGSENFVLFFIITTVTNLIYGGLLVFGVTQVFKKERFIIR